MNAWQLLIALLVAPLPAGMVILAIFGLFQPDTPGWMPNCVLAVLLCFTAGGVVLTAKLLIAMAA